MNAKQIQQSPVRQHSQVMNRQITLEIDYLLYVPKVYNTQIQQWPLIVFLHGAGERGWDINRVKLHGPPNLIEAGQDFDFIIASPQCPNGQWWPSRIEYVMALIDEIVKKYDVDENRIYLTGLSMGGFGIWTIAGMYPQRFAAIAPICGGGQPFLAGNLNGIPIWAFHGADDPVVPLERSQEMVDAVNHAGGHAKLTVYPGVGHDSWTETYNNDELYQWFLSHKKQD